MTSCLGDTLRDALDVLESRQSTYGDPRPLMADVAASWSLIFGTTVTPAQVALCMCALKLMREARAPGHADNWTDLAGYADLGRLLSEGA